MRSLILFCTLLIICGCQPILKTLYGIKQPKPVSTAYLIDFAERYGIGEDHLYFMTFERAERTYRSGEFSLQTARVFDHEGYHLPVDFAADSVSCESHAILSLLQNVQNLKDYPRSDSLLLSDYLVGLVDVQEQPVTMADLGAADYYVVGDWASFLGKTNKARFAEEEAYLKNSGLDIVYLKVNYDLREEWGAAQLKRLGFD